MKRTIEIQWQARITANDGQGDYTVRLNADGRLIVRRGITGVAVDADELVAAIDALRKAAAA